MRPMLPSTRLFHTTAILLFSLGPACFAQSVRVRVIDGKNGRLLPKRAISVQFLKEKLANASPALPGNRFQRGGTFRNTGNDARVPRCARDSRV